MKSYLFLLTLTVPFASAAFATEAPRPNILYFYVDDMGWGSIGPNGQAERKAKRLPYVRTPNIDRLAAQGVNFTRGYACTVCSPSRASQQSGYHQGHTFSDRNDPNNAKKAMRADDILMGDVLSAAGYETGYWGKWGYGGSKDQLHPVIDNVQTLPTSHGYRHVLAELHHVRAHTFFQPTLWKAPASPGSIGGLELVPNTMTAYKNDPTYPPTPALQNHAEYPRTGYCDDAYAFAALDFVREQGNQYNKTKKPFFGLLAAQIPHAPFGDVSALPNWDATYADDPKFKKLADQTRQWAAMVTRIDAHFGNILAALDDPNNDGDTSDSVADNTLVIFQSDNGGPSGKNNVELNANGGLRGNKGQIYEGGIRVPLVMRWPIKINADSSLKAGSNSDVVVDVTDLLPTFCDLAGTTSPVGLDGVSIAPTLLSNGHQRYRDFIVHEAGKTHSIIRKNFKLVRGGKTAVQLYDLNADHAETNNIAAAHPELVKELETLLLGERVTEPKGFANTYHHWTGKDGSRTSDSKNWSDYNYVNAGVTYMTDDGAPQLSWTAKIENSASQPNTARAEANLNFLGLEIKGNANGTQALDLAADVNLTGRNEIRISAGGIIRLNGSTLSSQRWIELCNGGVLTGHGVIDAEVFNNGVLTIGGSAGKTIKLNGDYQQSQSGTLQITLGKNYQTAVKIRGQAVLAGVLRVATEDGFQPKRGQTFVVVTAAAITETFRNTSDEIVAQNGTRFAIGYSDNKVTLTTK